MVNMQHGRYSMLTKDHISTVVKRPLFSYVAANVCMWVFHDVMSRTRLRGVCSLAKGQPPRNKICAWGGGGGGGSTSTVT